MQTRIIAGLLKGRKIDNPKNTETRPITSYLRKSLFDTINQEIVGKRLLDLFAGSGAIGIEGVSRGASSVTFVDNNKIAYQTLCKNITSLEITSSCHTIFGDAFSFLTRYKGAPFDFIFLDPPYPIGESGYTKLLLTVLENSALFDQGTTLVLEIPSTLRAPLNTTINTHFALQKEKTKGITTLFFLHIKTK